MTETKITSSLPGHLVQKAVNNLFDSDLDPGYALGLILDLAESGLPSAQVIRVTEGDESGRWLDGDITIAQFTISDEYALAYSIRERRYFSLHTAYLEPLG